jgi:hypothetical protein
MDAMITKHIVEAFTEALLLSISFGVAGTLILLCVQDFLRSRKSRKSKR